MNFPGISVQVWEYGVCEVTLLRKVSYGLDVFKARFLNKKFPLAVCWYLTYRCNYNCKYCGISGLTTAEEMSTPEIFSVISDLNKIGTKRIHFCGGESLLREDICEIVDYCKSYSMDVGIISNGSMVPKYAKKLTALYLLKLSFDGPQHIQDELRGYGAYDRLIEAVMVAKQAGIRVVFCTTLTRINLSSVEFILKKSKELNVPVIFAPINQVHSGSKNITDLLPSVEEYSRKIQYIINQAKNNGNIINSIPNLRYIASFPFGVKIGQCSAGRLFCHIKPNGQVYPCEATMLSDAPNCKDEGIESAFKRLPSVSCGQCWCSSTLELNLIYSLCFRSMINAATKMV